MRFQITKADLLPALKKVASIAEKKNRLLILDNILLEADDSRIVLTATDLEVGLSANVQVRSSEKGRITVSAKKFLDIVKALPEDADLDFSVDTQRVTLRSGKSKFTLTTQPAEEYPNIESVKDGKRFQVPQSVLRSLFSRTSFAMAANDVRYVLMGVLLEVEHGKLRVCATDGHRMAFCDMTEHLESIPNTQVVIPRKGVMELLKLLQDSESLVEVIIGINHICVVFPEVTFTSKLIDGKFPEYKRIIPQSSPNTVTADRDELKRAIQRTAIISNEKVQGVRIQAEDGKLIIKTDNQEGENAEEEMSVSYEGSPIEIGFNVKYVLDALSSSIKTDYVEIGLTSPDNSATFKDQGSDTCVNVIMPLRLK